MIKYLSVLGFLVLVLTGCPRFESKAEDPALAGAGAVSVQTTRPQDEERYILFVKNVKDRAFVESASKEAIRSGMRVLKPLSEGRGFVAQGDFARLQKIAEKHGINFERDQILRLRIPLIGRDHLMRQQTVPSGINQIHALETASKGAGVLVCVVDTGINLSHPDLKANIQDSFNTINTASAEDDNGHGTHVSGTIAAVNNTIGVIGVAPQAKLIAAKALNSQGSGYSSDLAEAIDGCRSRNAKVINASWGSATASQVITDAVNRALAANIFFVAATGNDGQPSVGFPANLPGVIAVSAVDVNDVLASFSNYGPEVAHAAPGVNTLSTYLGGRYKMLSGTSMATPHVSGAAAVLLSANPTAKPQDIDGVDIGLSPTQQGIYGRVDLSNY